MSKLRPFLNKNKSVHYAEKFLPPLQIPEGVFNVYSSPDGKTYSGQYWHFGVTRVDIKQGNWLVNIRSIKDPKLLHLNDESFKGFGFEEMTNETGLPREYAKLEVEKSGGKLVQSYFMEGEFLEFKNNQWINSEGYEVTEEYWERPFFSVGWKIIKNEETK